MSAIELYEGQRSPSLADDITSDGFDFAGSTVKLQMRPENGSTLKVNAAATITHVATGILSVRYDWAAPDVDTPGAYQAWWSVTLPGGLLQDGEEFPVIVKAHDGAASHIDLDSLRDHVETGIVDEALQTLLDDAIGQVEGRFGTDAEMTVSVEAQGRYIRLQRPALTITSIAEFNDQRYPLYTLIPADYELQHGGRTLRRLTGGMTFYANRQWAPVVTITYIPVPEQALRDRVVIDLVKLAVQYNALGQETFGGRTGYQSISIDYLRERERILSGVGNSRGFRFA